jgi:hypothetical protein
VTATSTTIRSQLMTVMSLHERLPRSRLLDIACSHPGCEWRELVDVCVDCLLGEGSLIDDGECIVYAQETEAPMRSDHLAIADAYRQRQAMRLTWSDRVGICLTSAWAWCRDHLDRILPGLILLVATSFLAIGLCAQEVPDSILRALVQVESGCDWRGIGDVRGHWSRGADGEVSCFQLSPAALSDMGVTNSARVHRDVVYAESLARLWLSRCYEKHGDWATALACYNSGSRYRSRKARDYSARIIALSTSD